MLICTAPCKLISFTSKQRVLSVSSDLGTVEECWGTAVIHPDAFAGLAANVLTDRGLDQYRLGGWGKR